MNSQLWTEVTGGKAGLPGPSAGEYGHGPRELCPWAVNWRWQREGLVMMMSDRRRAQVGANAGQAAQWDGPAGEHRIRHADVFDAQTSPLNVRFRAAAGIGPGDRVLDIGCGTGGSTRDAARAAVAGSAVGVDLSARMLEHARRAARAEGLRNVTYQQADAQVHQFKPARFDTCISRFGAMFFSDPVAAFTNIGRSLRPDARLVLMTWQAAERNEWSAAIRQALTTDPTPPAAPPPGPHPFTLADPAVAVGADHGPCDDCGMAAEGVVADCFVCRKHRDRGSLMPGGPVAEDDLVVVSQIVTPDALGRDGTTAYLGHLIVEPRRHAPGLADLAGASPGRTQDP